MSSIISRRFKNAPCPSAVTNPARDNAVSTRRYGTNLLSVLVLASLLVVLLACSGGEPSSDGGDAQFRRLTEAQYRNSIADIFGHSIVVGTRFDPLERVDGLLAIGASSAAITAAGLERYEAVARSIAMQVVDDDHREIFVPCAPVDASASDDTCAAEFLTTVGRFLFRRRLSEGERGTYVDIARDASDSLGDFYTGLAYSLTGMLVSPKFLYISETAEPDPDHPGKYRLDAYSKAARMSFLLWNTTPDAALLDAAESGELSTSEGLEEQFDRLMASKRTEVGLRAFFADMLEFDRFEIIEKDPIIYPATSMQLVEDAREQTLRTITYHLLDEERDYRDLFTSRQTFVSGPLGLIYRVPVNNPSGWVDYQFPEDSPWAGIHTQVSFQALFSHPGKSSPTLRGQAVRELLLCQKVPEPPGDVDFSDFNDDANAVNKTARQRLDVHNAEPTCAGCHKIMDPIGLAMEQFDGIGQFRTTENGAVIDTSGTIDGVPFVDAISLGQAIRDNPAAPACLMNRLYSYAVGRKPGASEREWMAYLKDQFEQSNYQVKGLLRNIVLSDAFYRVAPPQA